MNLMKLLDAVWSLSVKTLVLELKAAPMGYPLYKKLGFEDACSRCKEMNLKWENG